MLGFRSPWSHDLQAGMTSDMTFFQIMVKSLWMFALTEFAAITVALLQRHDETKNEGSLLYKKHRLYYNIKCQVTILY